MICPDKVRQFYCKVRQFYCKVRQFYCKVRQVLQSATIIKKRDRCSSKYANDSRLMNTSCFIKLAVILVTITNMYFFYTVCFFNDYLMVSLLFLNCLTLIINVVLTYRFIVHSTEKLVFPEIICQRHIHASDTQN